MAVTHRVNIGNNARLVVDASPTNGVAAAIGSVAVFDNAGVGTLFLKTGANDTDWLEISEGTGIQPNSQIVNTIVFCDPITPYNSPPALNNTYQTFAYFTFDKDDYTIANSTLQFKLDAIISSDGNNNSGNIRLATLGGTVISTTPIATGTSNPVIISSSIINNSSWPTGRNVIQIQMNRATLSTNTVELRSAILKIYNIF